MTCTAHNVDEFGTLPALKSLGTLADVRPILITDSREQSPLIFTRLEAVRGTLQSGDYSAMGIETQFAVERKSIADLVQCVTSERQRFERELTRLRGYRFKRLLIVGSVDEIEIGNYRSEVKPKSVLHSLAAWECRYDLPVVFEATPEAAARRVEQWVYFYCREITKSACDLLRGNRKAANV